MGEFGDRLRREREMRGITLDEISESTKISRRRLEALENEEFDLLPGGVFNRGFVRSYARYVGLDADQAVADYLAASHEQPAPADRFPLEVQESRPQRGSPVLNPRRSWIPIALAVLTLVIVMIGWTMWTRRHPRHAGSSTAVTPAHPATSPGPAAQPGQASGSQRSGSPQPGAATVMPETGNAAPSGPGASGAGAALPPAVPNDPAAPKKKSNTLAVTARSDSWVLIIADGKTVMEGVLDANQARSVKFADELVLRTGNAGGLDVTYNGKPLGGLGAENQVRTLRFPPRARAR